MTKPGRFAVLRYARTPGPVLGGSHEPSNRRTGAYDF